MHLIVYTSESTSNNTDINKTLNDISKKARINNKNLDITGLLFYHNQRFVQILEGNKESLEKLLKIIEKDKRHQNIERIIDEKVDKRGFKEWNMDSFNISENEIIDPVELKNITDAIKINLVLDSLLLSSLYKSLLNSHDLSPENHR